MQDQSRIQHLGFRRCLHDHISGKICGQRSAVSHIAAKFLFLLRIRHFTHQQQIGDLFKSQLFITQIPNQIFHPVSPVPELTITWYFLSIFYL